MHDFTSSETQAWENPLGIEQSEGAGLDTNIVDAVFAWYFFGLKPGSFTFLLLDAVGECGFKTWDSIPDSRKIEMIRAAHPMIRHLVKVHWQFVLATLPDPTAKWNGWTDRCLAKQSPQAIIKYLSEQDDDIGYFLLNWLNGRQINEIIGKLI